MELFGKGKINIYSAGIETHGLNPKAVQVMDEDMLNISSHTSNHIDEYMGIEFDFIITVCDHARENFPYLPSKAIRIHHNFPDPAQSKGSEVEQLNEFRKVRDHINYYCQRFVMEIFKD